MKLNPVAFLVGMIIAGLVSFATSCSEWPKHTYITASNGYNYRIVVIEGCEYFSGSAYGGNDVLTHKGNCTNAIHKVRYESAN